MGAPEGNKFWELRSKHGRDKIFSTPEIMWEVACEYFEWCDNNPYYINEQKRQKVIIPKDVKLSDEDFKEVIDPIVRIPTRRPYTISGFCLYLDCDESTFYRYGSDESHKDFFNIVTRVKKTIETQQFEGATVGIFNANIIARKLGLKEQTSHEIDDKRKSIDELFPTDKELIDEPDNKPES